MTPQEANEQAEKILLDFYNLGKRECSTSIREFVLGKVEAICNDSEEVQMRNAILTAVVPNWVDEAINYAMSLPHYRERLSIGSKILIAKEIETLHRENDDLRRRLRRIKEELENPFRGLEYLFPDYRDDD